MIATRKQEAYLFPLLFYGLITEVVIMTEKQKAVMELRLQGFCGSEIADRLGYSTKAVASLAKRVGLPFTDEERARSQALGHQKRRLSENELECIVEKYTAQFEYAGGYSGSEGTVRIRCKTCGAETERSIISIRHNNVCCEACARAATEERQKQRRLEALREREARKEKQRLMRLAIPGIQMDFKVCPVCNSLFVAGYGRKYCGPKCLSKASDNKDKRVRKIKTLTVDRGITLEGLYRRDGGVCHICGGTCDWKDMEIRETGTKVAGDFYPSIDHVIPLSKGGRHAWDNVKLAHRICNTRKSNKSPLRDAI